MFTITTYIKNSNKDIPIVLKMSNESHEVKHVYTIIKISI